jgi:hypothetical protein
MYNDCIYDHLTNATYCALICEPQYAALIALIDHLSIDTIRLILSFTAPPIDLSERTVRRLQKSIINGDFNTFKFIYDHEYMQPNILDWFEYDEILCDSVWNFYTLCECPTCEPTKIHRDLYVQPCMCLNGKRYIAFKFAYDETPECFVIHKTTKKQPTNDYQLIMNHIIDSGPIIVEHRLVSLKLF